MEVGCSALKEKLQNCNTTGGVILATTEAWCYLPASAVVLPLFFLHSAHFGLSQTQNSPNPPMLRETQTQCVISATRPLKAKQVVLMTS